MHVRTHLLPVLLSALVFAACDSDDPATPDPDPPPPTVQEMRVIGSGYADFVTSDGGVGDNRYWVDAYLVGEDSIRGVWRADVLIDYGGFVFDFEATYSVDCLEIDMDTREAWVEGVVFKANSDEYLDRRAFLYVKDGGPGGTDLQSITPVKDPAVTCTDRPEPDFTEEVESGDYVIEARTLVEEG